MPQRSHRELREFDSYVDSPTRTDKSAQEVVPTNSMSNPLYVYVVNDAGGGGSMLNTVTINSDFTVTDQDFILVIGSAPVTITLPPAATFTKKLVIKNVSTEDVTVIPNSGFVNGINSLEIRARRNNTYSAANLGNSITLIPEGGQFWLV